MNYKNERQKMTRRGNKTGDNQVNWTALEKTKPRSNEVERVEEYLFPAMEYVNW